MNNEEFKNALLETFEIAERYKTAGGLQGRIIGDMDIWQNKPERMIDWLKRTLPDDAKLVLLDGKPLQSTLRSDGLGQIILFISKGWPVDPEGRYSVYNLNGREIIPARPAEDSREVPAS